MANSANGGAALLLRGGRVIDPAQGLDGPLDVRVQDGRIDAVGADLPTEGAEVHDVDGLLVLPGLIDGHVHCFHGLGAIMLDPDTVGVSRGVTTVVDAGSSGHAAFPLFRDHVMAAARTRVLAYIHLSTMGGLLGPEYPTLADPRLIDLEALAAAVEANRERVVGVKVHAIAGATGPLGLQPLRQARALCDQLDTRLMVHIGETWSQEPAKPIHQVVDLLRPGDILTHMYTAQRGGLLDGTDRLHPAVQEARGRGVRFDVGHGSSNLNWDVAQRLLDLDFPPDSVSTDGSNRNLHWLVWDLPTVMSKLLALGLPLRDLVAMATCNAAAQIGRADELGSLAPGRVADVSVLRLEERDWTALDSQRRERVLPRRLVPVLTVRAGAVIYPRPLEAPQSAPPARAGHDPR
jgi:dihydroorotase